MGGVQVNLLAAILLALSLAPACSEDDGSPDTTVTTVAPTVTPSDTTPVGVNPNLVPSSPANTSVVPDPTPSQVTPATVSPAQPVVPVSPGSTDVAPSVSPTSEPNVTPTGVNPDPTQPPAVNPQDPVPPATTAVDPTPETSDPDTTEADTTATPDTTAVPSTTDQTADVDPSVEPDAGMVAPTPTQTPVNPEPMGEPGVRIVGRTVAGNNGSVRFAWPGVHFRARFRGTQISARLRDSSNQNRFEVVIDNANPKTITTSNGQEVYPLATGLADGEHEVLLWRNTESYKGVTEFVEFTDFGTGGALLAPPPAPDRRIEVIGDSISVGSGVEGPSAACTQDDYTKNYIAYGSIAARALGADIMTSAYSGIGVYYSYNGDTTMPERYDYAITNDQSPWDFSKYTPQVVVITLGTNDYSNGDPGQGYTTAYTDFVRHVRSKYSSAKLLLVVLEPNSSGPINSVQSTIAGEGADIEVLDMTGVVNYNACYHPDEAGQEAMGNSLTQRLRSMMGW